ncbi:MAG TPA: hydrolase [Pseudogracilibacillus sp.]|nr:hydrolase [Pseudogracilibacillus sp.]
MLKIEETALVVIDVQGKLAKIMHESNNLLSNIEKIIKGANVLNMPIIWLEQYPKGLGPTDDKLQPHLSRYEPIDKMIFSAFESEAFQEELKQLGRKNLLVTGIESHICVYQTVRQLLENDYYVEVLADCVSSRTAENSQIGIERMLALGAELTSVEMVLFELIRSAEHPNFKEISQIIK